MFLSFLWLFFLNSSLFQLFAFGLSTSVRPVQVKGPKKSVRERVVIGTENRYRYDDPEYPWASVGQIDFGVNGLFRCTGSLVGPRHVLTNSHCVDLNYPIYYKPSYNNGKYYRREKKINARCIAHGTITSDTRFKGEPNGFSYADDWAILLLDEPIGRRLGWLKIMDFNNNWLNKSLWFLASYSSAGILNQNGTYPVFQKYCSLIEYARGGELFHDCDSNQGSSGSSIMGKFSDNNYYVIALNNAQSILPDRSESCPKYNTYNCYNLAVKTSKFKNAVLNAIQMYP